MQNIFSAEIFPFANRFRRWREVCEYRLVPMNQEMLDDGPFSASIDAASIGGINFSRFKLSNVFTEITQEMIRKNSDKTDSLFLSIVVEGKVQAAQNGISGINKVGDISIRDPNRPFSIKHEGYTDVLAIEIPRNKLEASLGSAHRFVGSILDGKRPINTLTREFLFNAAKIGGNLTLPTAERIAATAIDLVMASVAEQLVLETSKEIQHSVAMYNAKLFINKNLNNMDLNPYRVAMEIGLSLRNLQIIFSKHGKTISDYIWELRVEMAANRLSDPLWWHAQLGTIAYSCGFTNQSHFSSRFREKYGINPSEYRQRSLSKLDKT